MIKFLCQFCFLSVLGLSLNTFAAGKFDMMGGFFSLSAKADKKEGSVSGPGSYVATYHHGVLPHLDFSMGYSLFMSKIVLGDLGYGPDMGFTYYPSTESAPISVASERISFYIKDNWRYFTNFSFHQRNFQSIDSGYAGFSLGGGLEMNWKKNVDFKFLGRYLLLKGPEQSTASQVDLFFGICFGI